MAAKQIDKVVLTNYSLLKAKYGASGVKVIKDTVKRLIAADAQRGLITAVVDLGNAIEMTKYGLAAIPPAAIADEQRHKEAVDTIYCAQHPSPDYLLLLGAPDVIPHIALTNPVFAPPTGDVDPNVPSDLPYACEAPFSTDIQTFVSPTRVVGRLPNIVGDTDPAYLAGLLDASARHKERPATDYHSFLGISTHHWRKSTKLTLNALLGTASGMQVSPSDGPKWTAAQAKALLHFINCHGAPANPDFYGEKGNAFPVAHSAAWMQSKVVPGTLAVAECCYGAELYDPSLTGLPYGTGMSNTYLGAGAAAFFGSTNIAYGPADTNDLADVICRDFTTQVLAGASVGRACLEARLAYVSSRGTVLRPLDLKTLAQFTLLADPSVTPVEAATSRQVVAVGGKSLAAKSFAMRQDRWSRRVDLAKRAVTASVFKLTADRDSDSPPMKSSRLLGTLRKLAARFDIIPDVILSHRVEAPSASHEPDSTGSWTSLIKGVVARRFDELSEARGIVPTAVYTLLQRSEAKHGILLVRGMDAVEFAGGLDVRTFESR